MPSSPLTIASEGFLLNGQPFRFFAGAIHYFRVPREYWKDRLLKLKACGFNTVETYVAWNAHQPTPESFDYTGILDLPAFLETAQELGLYVILRPGPYICSEWEFGGLPWWLLSQPGMKLRCMNAPYLKAVDRFFDDLIPRISPYFATNGGPILMMQVENEYGSYGNDKGYLQYLANGLRSRGVNLPLFTSDGAEDSMLTGGTMEGILSTVNFGSRAKEQFEKLRKHRPEGPLMCCEFWNGWFDHWGEEHHSRSPKEAAAALREILDCGASFYAYMFHGGTNFGWMNGANCYEHYEPTVNSYDDDAPLDECGDPTPKYAAFRELMGRYVSLPDLPVPQKLPKAKYGKVTFTQWADLLDSLPQLSSPIRLTAPVPMEQLGQGYGLILYRSQIQGPRNTAPVILQQVRDRAHIFANGALLGICSRMESEPKTPELAVSEKGVRLDVLVENMGRTNYGYHMWDTKGITEGVRHGQMFLYGWEAWPLPLQDLNRLQFHEKIPGFSGRPMFLKGEWDIQGTPADSFVKLPGFRKGLIFVNGKLLSRYWEIGPQRSAYLPAPWLREGTNQLVVLELDGFEQPQAFLDDFYDLGSRTE